MSLIENEEVKEETKEQIVESNEVKEEVQTFKQMSPLRLIFRRFFRSKLSIVGLVMLISLFLFAFVGPLFSPYGETTIDETLTYQINNVVKNIDGVEIVVEIETPKKVNTLASPSGSHLLGTDDKGMDAFTRLMYGGRISLFIGFIVIILETVVGVILGALAGYFGKWVDSVIMRLVDIFNCIPMLPILLIASSLLDSLAQGDNPLVTQENRIYFLMIILTVFGWAGTARLVRGQILSLREQEFIVATEVMGLPTWRRIFKHLVPNVMPQLIVSMTLGLGSVILYESTLSYLGLGVQPPYAAWGTMIAKAKDTSLYLPYYPNLWLPAGILIVIAVLGFNFVGDGLRDAMDPKGRR